MKQIQNEVGEKFSFAIVLVAVSMTISLLAFNSADKNITGLAVLGSAQSESKTVSNNLKEFKNFVSLGSLAVGAYYIDDKGVVFSVDDKSNAAIGKVDSIEEIQKNRLIYVDKEGKIGYVLNSITLEH